MVVEAVLPSGDMGTDFLATTSDDSGPVVFVVFVAILVLVLVVFVVGLGFRPALRETGASCVDSPLADIVPRFRSLFRLD